MVMLTCMTYWLRFPIGIDSQSASLRVSRSAVKGECVGGTAPGLAAYIGLEGLVLTYVM